MIWRLSLLLVWSWLLLISALPNIVVAAESDVPAEKEPVSPTVTAVPELDDFLIIPLRVYRLKSTELPAVNCELTDQDLRRVVGKVNRVWAYGGIYFGLEPIQEETAATDRLLRLPEKKEEPKNTPPEKNSEKSSPQEKQKEQNEEPVKEQKEPAAKPLGQGAEQLLDSRLYRALIPPKSREFPGFRVYYIHQFDVNGIYYGRREAMVKETARLRKVPGGIDEPIPRVTAHELGHGLTLPHRQDNTNLMASGTTGTTFNEAEIAQARKAAKELPAAIAYGELEKPAAKRTEAEQKQRAEWAADLRAIVMELRAKP